ncbi:hypothetical protein [Rhodococcus sp. UNC363MFTsu5.1]|uniref:hypothetical protein n=1 Tax=Rhodococcus sp. UNC363MFTsu5.1 TaxID=1449069 RepID=UPI0004805132|nr:hypothetical protein [Rhodococcus sp. UNC363MFTsu5.1]
MSFDDHDDAADLGRARVVVDEAGAAGLARRPWQHPGQPASDGDLVRFTAWTARDARTTDPAVVGAGLRLLASARAELDQSEAGLLFAARGAGMTWTQIADALGLSSAQAAQQRLNRVLTRVTGPDTES